MLAHIKKPKRLSPLKSAPLRNPGQSLDEEIHRIISEDIVGYIRSVVGPSQEIEMMMNNFCFRVKNRT